MLTAFVANVFVNRHETRLETKSYRVNFLIIPKQTKLRSCPGTASNHLAAIAAANPAIYGTDLLDDGMIFYFATLAFFRATPAYSLHRSCIMPVIWAQRVNASAASLKWLKFSKSAPRMKRSV